MNESLDYRSAGVNLDEGAATKKRFAELVESTRTAGMRGAFGDFGGMMRIPAGARAPVLVASADGVGTKLKIASQTARNDTVGHDLVNHCVNDILVQGARPLFFLDYVAFGVLDSQVAVDIVAGVAAGCRENGCALLGGETAQMPDLYTPPDYDLAGFIVGWLEDGATLGAHRVKEGDTLLGLASSGLHTNGYSLARRIVADRLRLGFDDPFPGEDVSVGDVLLRVHRSYLRALEPVLDQVHALAHITGGGLVENLPRVLPEGIDAVIDTASWTVPNEFAVLQRAGGVSPDEMFRVFNMGVGMVVITPEASVDAVLASARAAGVSGWRLGRTRAGTGRTILT